MQKALALDVNVIQTSSMGRLFDAAASLLGLADFNSHQGRCAMALESVARTALMEKIQPLPLAFTKELVKSDENNKNSNNRKFNETINADGKDNYNLEKVLYNPAPVWEALLQVKRERKDICAAALGFHFAVVNMVTDMAERMGVKQVVLFRFIITKLCPAATEASVWGRRITGYCKASNVCINVLSV